LLIRPGPMAGSVGIPGAAPTENIERALASGILRIFDAATSWRLRTFRPVGILPWQPFAEAAFLVGIEAGEPDSV
jgi:hypothetical protein